jgi:hypothetical protein
LITISNNELLDHLKSGEKFWSVSLQQFRLLLNRIFFLRGQRESLVSIPNTFLFFGTVEVFEKYDPVMREHWDSASEKPGCLPYSSPDIKNGLINLLGARALQIII